MTPIHEHDCDECIFLGNSKDGTQDLYYHLGENETVISRFGVHGDYASGMVFIGRNPYLTEAYEIARERDLL
jgi:hypothetical protein